MVSAFISWRDALLTRPSFSAPGANLSAGKFLRRLPVAAADRPSQCDMSANLADMKKPCANSLTTRRPANS